MRIWREIVPPLVTAYAVFVVVVVRAWRAPTEPSKPRPTPGPRAIVLTIAGGYLVFLAIVAVFHVGLAGERGAFLSAVTGGLFLGVLATAVYAVCVRIRALLAHMR